MRNLDKPLSENITELRDMIDRAENIKPIKEVNGVKLVTFEEQRDAATLDAMNNTGLDTVQYNQDGSVARTPVKYAAINPDHYYINRYKKVKDSIYLVVDYRLITEQADGNVYLKTIPAFVIKRNDEKKLFLEKVVTVSDTEFVSDFTHILGREAMAEILPLIANGVGVTMDDLPI